MKLREFNTYREMEDAHQKDINDFPITYMFGRKTDEEIKEELAKIGAKSLDECCSVFGCGDVVRKADVPKLKELFTLQHRERRHFTENEKKLVEMIYYEMNNHEYGYTQDPHDTLMALGKSYSDLETDERFFKAWSKAEKQCFKDFDEVNR